MYILMLFVTRLTLLFLNFNRNFQPTRLPDNKFCFTYTRITAKNFLDACYGFTIENNVHFYYRHPIFEMNVADDVITQLCLRSALSVIVGLWLDEKD